METAILYAIVLSIGESDLLYNEKIKTIKIVRKLIKCGLVEGKELVERSNFIMLQTKIRLIVTPEQLGHIYAYQWEETSEFPYVTIESLKRHLPDTMYDVTEYSVKK